MTFEQQLNEKLGGLFAPAPRQRKHAHRDLYQASAEDYGLDPDVYEVVTCGGCGKALKRTRGGRWSQIRKEMAS